MEAVKVASHFLCRSLLLSITILDEIRTYVHRTTYVRTYKICKKTTKPSIMRRLNYAYEGILISRMNNYAPSANKHTYVHTV